MDSQKEKSNGALIGSIVIIALLILGGVYLWLKIKQEQTETQNLDISSQNGGDDPSLDGPGRG